MKRKVPIPVEIKITLRRQGTTKDDRWTGHLLLNGQAICGEPVHKPVKISWNTFTQKTCKKCRDLLDRGTFGAE